MPIKTFNDRLTQYHALLCSYESGSLGIPGLRHSFIDITSAMLAGNGSSRTSSFATSYVFLAVDFERPFGASKSYARN